MTRLQDVDDHDHLGPHQKRVPIVPPVAPRGAVPFLLKRLLMLGQFGQCEHSLRLGPHGAAVDVAGCDAAGHVVLYRREEGQLDLERMGHVMVPCGVWMGSPEGACEGGAGAGEVGSCML